MLVVLLLLLLFLSSVRVRVRMTSVRMTSSSLVRMPRVPVRPTEHDQQEHVDENASDRHEEHQFSINVLGLAQPPHGGDGERRRHCPRRRGRGQGAEHLGAVMAIGVRGTGQGPPGRGRSGGEGDALFF